MKFTLLLLVTAITVSASTALNYTFGYVDYRFDRLLFSKDIYVPRKLFNEVKTYVDYPSDGHVGFDISAINVINKIEKGAKPKIKSGGVHHKLVSIKLTSAYMKPINATVQIYGRLY